MKTDLDEIIKKVAVRNGAGLRKDDAVIQLVTVIDSIMENHTKQLAEKQQELLTSFAEKTETTLNRINADMKEHTERSVNATAKFALDMLPRILTDGTNAAVTVAKGELGMLVTELNESLVGLKKTVAGCGQLTWGTCIVLAGVALLIILTGLRIVLWL